jgi:6-pyruvoyltetrahydropterin/6-carboxytetrahydropterin synthase
MYNITRDYTFEAAHRLEGHPKCGRLHGHSYLVKVTITAPELRDGMVIDFGTLDQFVKPLIDKMDHKYLVSQENVQQGDGYTILAEQKEHAFILGMPRSTSENLAKLIHGWVYGVLLIDPTYVKITVHETAKSGATYEAEEN